MMSKWCSHIFLKTNTYRTLKYLLEYVIKEWVKKEEIIEHFLRVSPCIESSTNYEGIENKSNCKCR